MNFGVTLVAAPKAASSRVAIYSFTARLAVSASRSLIHSEPGSTAACWRPPRSGSHRPQTPYHRPVPTKYMPQRHAQRPGEKCRCHGTAHCGRENTEWSGILSSMLKPQNQRYARLTLTSRQRNDVEIAGLFRVLAIFTPVFTPRMGAVTDRL